MEAKIFTEDEAFMQMAAEKSLFFCNQQEIIKSMYGHVFSTCPKKFTLITLLKTRVSGPWGPLTKMPKYEHGCCPLGPPVISAL